MEVVEDEAVVVVVVVLALAGLTVSTEEEDLLVTSSVGVASPPEGLELTDGLEASLTPESASSEEASPLRREPPAPEEEGVEGPK